MLEEALNALNGPFREASAVLGGEAGANDEASPYYTVDLVQKRTADNVQLVFSPEVLFFDGPSVLGQKVLFCF